MKKLLSVKRKGFTLIELLVVIAIIAILAVIGIAIFTGVQARGRDAKRQADTIAISKAFEANKVSGSISYTAIATTWFAGGVIPAETGYSGATPPQYSIAYVSLAGCTVSLAVQASRSWVTNTANPTAASFTVTGTGCPATPTVANASTAPIGMISFQVCSLLENGTAPNFFCKPNSQ